MKSTPLSREHALSVLSYDPSTGVFRWKARGGSSRLERVRDTRFAGKVAGRIQKGYVRISIDGRSYFAHRLAWLIVHGDWPALEIDHINGDRADNRASNLRLATSSQNKANTGIPVTNTSGVKGVYWAKHARKWCASIKVSGKNKHLGYYADLSEAAAAYRKAVSELHGEFGRVK